MDAYFLIQDGKPKARVDAHTGHEYDIEGCQQLMGNKCKGIEHDDGTISTRCMGLVYGKPDNPKRSA